MIEITVIGEPAPQGSKRGFRAKGGKILMVESSSKVRPWRQDVVAAAQAVGQKMIGPVAVDIIFTLRKPKSAPKRRRSWPNRKPDIDKLVRSTLDALTQAGTIWDDACVVSLYAVKTFPGEFLGALAEGRGAVIRIRSVEELYAWRKL